MSVHFHTEELIFERIIELENIRKDRKKRFNQYVEKLQVSKQNSTHVQIQRKNLNQERQLIRDLNELFNGWIKSASSVNQAPTPTTKKRNSYDPFLPKEYVRAQNIAHTKTKWSDHY